jgi:uncharacterized membrane protein
VPETVTPQVTVPPDPAASAPTPTVRPLPLNFHNRAAVKIALLVAGLATLLSFLLYLNWFLAGFLAVFLYRRRTGQVLNLESGVRMGWITGLMTFGIMVLILGCFGVSVQAIGGVSAFQAEFKGMMDPRMTEFLKMLSNPSELAMVLVQFFVFTTLLSMAGGALGVKLRINRPTGS